MNSPFGRCFADSYYGYAGTHDPIQVKIAFMAWFATNCLSFHEDGCVGYHCRVNQPLWVGCYEAVELGGVEDICDARYVFHGCDRNCPNYNGKHTRINRRTLPSGAVADIPF